MSLTSIFVDAFNKAKGKKKPEIDMKTYGPMGSTTQSASGSFDPLRPAPESDTGQGIDTGAVPETRKPDAGAPG